MDAIIAVRKQFVTMPDTATCERISNEIESRGGFPNCLGFIDGTLIPITPPKDSDGAFWTRKHFAGWF